MAAIGTMVRPMDATHRSLFGFRRSLRPSTFPHPMVPAQGFVGQWLQSFREFPPRQKPATFSLDQVIRFRSVVVWQLPCNMIETRPRNLKLIPLASTVPAISKARNSLPMATLRKYKDGP